MNFEKPTTNVMADFMDKLHTYLFIKPISADILKRDGFEVINGIIYTSYRNSCGSFGEGSSYVDHLDVIEDDIVKELCKRYDIMPLREEDETFLSSYKVAKQKLSCACNKFKKEIMNEK